MLEITLEINEKDIYLLKNMPTIFWKNWLITKFDCCYANVLAIMQTLYTNFALVNVKLLSPSLNAIFFSITPTHDSPSEKG